MSISMSLVSGLMLGFEFFDDEDENESYIILDLLFFRVMFWWKNDN